MKFHVILIIKVYLLWMAAVNLIFSFSILVIPQQPYKLEKFFFLIIDNEGPCVIRYQYKAFQNRGNI